MKKYLATVLTVFILLSCFSMTAQAKIPRFNFSITSTKCILNNVDLRNKNLLDTSPGDAIKATCIWRSIDKLVCLYSNGNANQFVYLGYTKHKSGWISLLFNSKNRYTGMNIIVPPNKYKSNGFGAFFMASHKYNILMLSKQCAGVVSFSKYPVKKVRKKKQHRALPAKLKVLPDPKLLLTI